MKIVSESNKYDLYSELVDFFTELNPNASASAVLSYLCDYFSSYELEGFLQHCYQEAGIEEDELY